LTPPRFIATQFEGVPDPASLWAAGRLSTARPCCPRRSIMSNRTTLTRSERLALAGAAIRGVLAGAAHAAITWLLVHLGT
jgi:hypothetical protein